MVCKCSFFGKNAEMVHCIYPALSGAGLKQRADTQFRGWKMGYSGAAGSHGRAKDGRGWRAEEAEDDPGARGRETLT